MNAVDTATRKWREHVAHERALAGKKRRGRRGSRRAWKRTVNPPQPIPLEHQHAAQRRAAGLTPERRRKLLEASHA